MQNLIYKIFKIKINNTIMNKILFYSLLLINSNFNTQNSLHTSDSQIENKYDWSFKNKKNLILLSSVIVILIILMREFYKIKKKREEKRKEREKDIIGYNILSGICRSENILITITNYHEVLNNAYDYKNNANGTYLFLANLFYNNNKDKFNKTSEITESILKILNSKNKINIEIIERIEKIEDIRKKLIEAIYNKFITEGKPRLFEIIKYNDTYIFKNKIESNEEKKAREEKIREEKIREELIKIANKSNIEEPKKPIKIKKKNQRI